MNKYFLTDLDGTLLDNNAVLSKESLETLLKANELGIVISYATARSFTSSISATTKMSWKYPVVLYNGALIIDPVEKRVLKVHYLNHKLTDSIIKIGKQKGLTPLLFCLDDNDNERVFHEKLYSKGYINFYNSRKDDPRFSEVDSLVAYEECRTIILTYIGLYDELEPLRQSLVECYQDDVNIHFMKDNYIENHYFLEVTHKMANKEEGLMEWCRLLGCDPTEVTVFGDNLNDLALFEKAGKKVAVSNAHQQLKAQSDIIIDSNEDGGVVKYIESVI